jgi:hypothetical protein
MKNYFTIRFLFSNLFLMSLAISQSQLSLKNDNRQIKEDESVEIDILENDNIQDKSNLIIEIISKPEKGNVKIQGNNLIYTPNPDENGVDKLKYKVDTGIGIGSAEVKININPVNDSPTGLSLIENKITENSKVGKVIGTLEVLDPDSDDEYKFGLAKENREDFKIKGSKLIASRAFNYEQEKSISVSIQVTDSGGEKIISSVDVIIVNQNEPPFLEKKAKMKYSHSENSGKIVCKLNVIDPDEDQSKVRFKLLKGEDNKLFKITRNGDLSFLRTPDFENPGDKDKDNVYLVSFLAIDSKDETMNVKGNVSVNVKNSEETEVLALDKRKYTAWVVDHQPYHILLEDAIKNYMTLKYFNSNDEGIISDGEDTFIREMKPTDQVIIVQQKSNNNEIHEIWYGNGLEFIIIDREKVDWIFSQDIQKILLEKDEYLTSDSEVVFHESETDRLMAGYGSIFSVWHSNNFKMSLSSFSMRSNLVQYSSNLRVGNSLIGLPGLLSGSSELGVATKRSEFGLRVPFAFDFGSTDYKNVDVMSSDYLGLFARGNIDNLFSTKASLYGLIGFSFYPSSSGAKLNSLIDITDADNDNLPENLENNTKNINILDSYALIGTTVEVPLNLPSVGRLTASPGFHYLKVAHRLKDNREEAVNSNQELYDRTFYDQKFISNDSYSQKSLNDDDNSFTRLTSFYIRFDLTGKIGEKPNFIEKISFLDFIKVKKVPFYEISLQYISELNILSSININLNDQIGLSLTRLAKVNELKGNWMPDSKFWFGFNYRANF